MKIGKDKILEISKKYPKCVIEEIYENHNIMGNYCCITCDLAELIVDGVALSFTGEIFDFLAEIRSFDNVKNLVDETLENDYKGFYEYVTFEWT